MSDDCYYVVWQICLDGGLECDPDCRDLVDKNGEASNLAIVENYVTKMFPHLHPKPAIRERCMYTVCFVFSLLPLKFS